MTKITAEGWIEQLTAERDAFRDQLAEAEAMPAADQVIIADLRRVTESIANSAGLPLEILEAVMRAGFEAGVASVKQKETSHE